MQMACLGLDTSCYTTSVALCGAESGAAEAPFFQERQLLTVPQGERGLMQSEGVFQHISRLPALLDSLLEAHRDMRIAGVCASVRPRPQADSYMPVFRVGESVGLSIAKALDVPFFATSHQEGHLRAAMVGTPVRPGQPVLAVHMSGGTTEVLQVMDGEITLLGGTKDLHAGQLIDRIGVAMGLPFPAGPHLEKLAVQGQAASTLKAVTNGMDCHFSGAEAQAVRLMADGETRREDIAAEVFACVARTVAKLSVAAHGQTDIYDVLIGGGVASSALIRETIMQRVAARSRHIHLHFARPALSGDNAVGIALIGVDRIMHHCG